MPDGFSVEELEDLAQLVAACLWRARRRRDRAVAAAADLLDRPALGAYRQAAPRLEEVA